MSEAAVLNLNEAQRLDTAKALLRDVVHFTREMGGLALRQYQQDVARAVIKSVFQGLGLSFVIMFPRQSGKNELQAQIEAFLLAMYRNFEVEMVKVSPTWKPQSLNAMRRLERVLNRNLLTRGNWKKESGYIYRVGNARIFFLSGSPETNIVGATANLLLQVDEAQDVRTSKFDKDIAPMASSTNATRVFWGTAWTGRTLLARELQAARQAEQQDGIRRAFVIDAEDVAREVPAYGRFVAGQVSRLGRDHPLVRTQYFAEEIHADGGMFPPERRALMQGRHIPQDAPLPGEVYAALIDLAGEDEGAGDDPQALQNPGRDLTAVTIVLCDLRTLHDEGLQAPVYRVVGRREWIGVRHSELYGKLRALLEHWSVRYAVVDATGVGAGLTSFLVKTFGERIIPFVFTAASKSQLGWDFLSICDSGRWKEAQVWGSPGMIETSKRFWEQCEFCEYRVLDVPGKRMCWGVPDGRRHPETGEVLHDDLLVSAALSAVLDRQNWVLTAPGVILQTADVLDDLDAGF